MDPYNKNKLKLREAVKKIRRKPVKLIIDDDNPYEPVDTATVADTSAPVADTPVADTVAADATVADTTVAAVADTSAPAASGFGAEPDTIQERDRQQQQRIRKRETVKKPSVVDSEGVFAEDKQFDVLDIGTQISRKRDILKTISEDDIVHTNENTIFKPEIHTNIETIHEITNAAPKGTTFYYYNVCYTIRYDAMKPYIMYYMYKYPKSTSTSSSDVIIFPFKKYSVSPSSGSLIDASKTLASKIFSSKQREHIHSTPEGYIYNETYKSFYIVYQFNASGQYTFSPDPLKRSQQFWWCLPDELVNYQKVLNFPVSKHSHSFLLQNPSLLYLHHKKEDGSIGYRIETPAVGFHGTHYDLLPLIVSYGLKPSTLYPMMGPYYYFGTFRKAVRYAGWTSTYKPRKIGDAYIADKYGLYNKGGIVRFALFLGKMKAFMNLPTDVDDKSERYYNRVRSASRNEIKYENIILKMHDHDGKWVEQYNSAYVGRSRLSSGGLFMKNPEFVTREFEQQALLSYHELDKTTLTYDDRRKNYKWDPSSESYSIM